MKADGVPQLLLRALLVRHDLVLPDLGHEVVGLHAVVPVAHDEVEVAGLADVPLLQQRRERRDEGAPAAQEGLRVGREGVDDERARGPVIEAEIDDAKRVVAAWTAADFTVLLSIQCRRCGPRRRRPRRRRQVAWVIR